MQDDYGKQEKTCLGKVPCYKLFEEQTAMVLI